MGDDAHGGLDPLHIAADTLDLIVPTNGSPISVNVPTHFRVVATVETGAPPPDTMTLIPPGLFQMGDPGTEGGSAELPVHTVTVSACYIDRFEVSNEEMRMVLQWAYDQGLVNATQYSITNNEGTAHLLMEVFNPSSHLVFSNGNFHVLGGRTNFPCHHVTWYGAQAYCNYRSDMDGVQRCIDFTDWSCDFSKNGYRLPTETEWEKAARGGLANQHYPWPSSGGSFNDHIDGTMANFKDSGDAFEEPWPNVNSTPTGYFDGNQTPSGPDIANGYGLYDVAGNVWEWCWDWYESDWYQQADATGMDTKGPPPSGNRSRRGGSWTDSKTALRCSKRSGVSPAAEVWNQGFRSVRRP